MRSRSRVKRGIIKIGFIDPELNAIIIIELFLVFLRGWGFGWEHGILAGLGRYYGWWLLEKGLIIGKRSSFEVI